MARIANEITGAAVEFEISIDNVDKPQSDYSAIDRRTRQFNADQTVWLTRAPTFAEKSRIFRNVIFVAGIDTIERLAVRVAFANHGLL